MVVVMKPDAEADDISAVIARVESVGGEAFVSRGVTRTIIGLVGDVETFGGLNLRAMPGVADVMRVSAPYKLVSRIHHPEMTTVYVGGVPIGPDTFTLIAGPCAVETHQQTLEAAQMAQAAGATLLRGGAYKPRTSPYAFQGLGEEGLRILAEVREETGLPIVTEVVDAHDVDLVASYADMLQVGTRNMAELRAAAGGRPVRQAGDAQARHEGHHRGVADGRGVHRPARQPRHRAVRARHPHVRDGDPQHPRHQRRAGRARPRRTCRSSSTRRTPAAGATWWCRCRARRSRSAPTA